MERVFLCFIVLSLRFVISQFILSPCPDTFEYGIEGDKIYGIINLKRTSSEPAQYILLKTDFTIPVRLNHKLAGRIKARDSENLLENYNAGFPVTYRVQFAISSPLPRLTALRVNGNLLCQGPTDISSPYQQVTAFSLQHMSKLRNDQFIINSTPGNVYFNGPPSTVSTTVTTMNTERITWMRPSTPVYQKPVSTQSTTSTTLTTMKTERVTWKPPLTPIYQKPVFSQTTSTTSRPVMPLSSDTMECGIVIGGNEELPATFIGQSFARGEIPWLVAIFSGGAGSLRFTCSGTLISNQHVVTAANCMYRGTQLLSSKEFAVKAGVHNLDKWNDNFSVMRNIRTVSVYDFYNASTLENDLVVLTLDRPVEFNDYITPACLWRGHPRLSSVIGTSGVLPGRCPQMAGWGKHGDEKLVNRGLPRAARLPIVTISQCRATKTYYHYITNSKTLCAGDQNGVGPCRGETGGGLYLLREGRWRLRGVVSRFLKKPDSEDACNLDGYIVFTDTAKLVSWIESVVANTVN